MNLSANDILSFSKGEVRKISVPEWGGEIHLRSFDYGQMKRFKKMCNEVSMSKIFGMGETTVEDVETLLLVNSICDEKGNLLFSDSKEDQDKLNNMRGNEKAFEFVVNAIDELNDLRPKEADKDLTEEEIQEATNLMLKKK